MYGAAVFLSEFILSIVINSRRKSSNNARTPRPLRRGPKYPHRGPKHVVFVAKSKRGRLLFTSSFVIAKASVDLISLGSTHSGRCGGHFLHYLFEPGRLLGLSMCMQGNFLTELPWIRHDCNHIYTHLLRHQTRARDWPWEDSGRSVRQGTAARPHCFDCSREKNARNSSVFFRRYLTFCSLATQRKY